MKKVSDHKLFYVIYIAAFIFLTVFTSFQFSKNSPDPATVTDIDGNVYHTVIIGKQLWMVENLNVIHYRNGDPIPNVSTGSEWSNLTTGAYCNYNNSAENAAIYGRLYNWYAVNDSRNIAPEGWHVATDEDWKQLEMYLGMSQSEADKDDWRGTNEGSRLAGNADLWLDGKLKNNASFGDSVLTLLPGGMRSIRGKFYNMGMYAHFWSSTERDNDNALGRHIDYLHPTVYHSYYSKLYGYSVRCVMD